MQFSQLEVIGCPVVNVTVWGNDLEDFDKSIAFEVYGCTRGKVAKTLLAKLQEVRCDG
jgi:hypothetical protein